MAPQISAALLLDAMMRLRPDCESAIRRIAEDIAAGHITGPIAFSEKVSESLGSQGPEYPKIPDMKIS